MQRHRTIILLISSFVPGLQTLAPAAAASIGTSAATLIGLRVFGVACWVMALSITGYIFADRVIQV